MSNQAKYRKICEANHDIPLFSQPWWLDAVCHEWDVAIAMKGEYVCGTWAYPIEKKLGVYLMRMPLITPYLGPQVFFPPDLKESKTDSFEHATITDLINQLPSVQVWHMAVAPGLKQAGLFKNFGLQPEVKQTFLIDLNQNEATLLANLQDTLRKNIRQADTTITITNAPDCITQLYEYQNATLNKKGKKTYYDLAFLQKILDGCVHHQSGTIWAAKEIDNNVSAVVWQVWDKKCSYYLMGAQNPGANGHKAMSALLWHCINEAKNKGIPTFDLEGSMDEGVERFFRGFGGSRTLYMVLQKNKSLLWKMKRAVLG